MRIKVPRILPFMRVGSVNETAAEKLFQNNQITMLEFSFTRNKWQVFFQLLGLPAWFQPAVDEAVATAVTAATARFTMRLENIEARQLNSVVRDSTEVLYPIRNDAGGR
jgi:hypothetical protein